MSPRTVWGYVANAAVEAGPIDRESLRQLIAASVPPAVAIQTAESWRNHSRAYARRKGAKPRPGSGKQLDTVMVGARAKANQIIKNRLHAGAWIGLPDGRIATREWVAANRPLGDKK